jgi:hypothetical protein
MATAAHRVLLQTRLNPATFCSKDRCSTIEPLKQGEIMIELIFVIFDFSTPLARSLAKPGKDDYGSLIENATTPLNSPSSPFHPS